MMSVRAVPGVQGFILVALTAAFVGGCSGSTPAKPGSAGHDGGAAGTSGTGGTAGSPAGSAGAGEDAAAGSVGTGGAGVAGSATDGGGGSTGGAPGTAGVGGSAGTGGGGVGGSGGSGGAAGAGIAGATGLGGVGGSSAAGGNGGGAGVGGPIGAGGAVQACGDVGSPCCAGSTCNGGNICLNGGVCSCAKSLFGSYFVRTDGIAIDVSQTVQTPVLNAATGQPLTGVVSVADGIYHGCAALSDGTAWCWRTNAASGNSVGQVGNGSTDTNGAIFRATQVLKAASSPLTGVKSISDSANNSTCAIMTDGKLYCWGTLTWIVNGGTPLNSGFAQAITLDGNAPLGNVVQASTGANQGCAIVQGASSKELWCWGYNQSYELGLGDQTPRQYPTKVVGPINPTKVIAGQYTYNGATGSCVLDGDTVRCWGYNGYGQSGANSTANALTSPTLVVVSAGTATLNGIVDLFLGGRTYCALRSSNTLWCWGSGYSDYAGNFGVTNIVTAGQSDPALYLTSDGIYHFGATKVTPNCGVLQ